MEKTEKDNNDLGATTDIGRDVAQIVLNKHGFFPSNITRDEMKLVALEENGECNHLAVPMALDIRHELKDYYIFQARYEAKQAEVYKREWDNGSSAMAEALEREANILPHYDSFSHFIIKARGGRIATKEEIDFLHIF